MRLVTPWCSGYPPALRALGHLAPPRIALCGNEALLTGPAVSVAGARLASPRAIEAAAAFGKAFAGGYVVVSGGAAGVDTSVHRAVIEAGGQTVVVLAQGLRTYMPPDWIRGAMAAGNILCMSSTPDSSPWRQHHAVARNPVIAALGQAAVVIEPRSEGGSFKTAGAALDLGKHVVIVPGGRNPTALQAIAAKGAVVISAGLQPSALPAAAAPYLKASDGAPVQDRLL